MKFEVYKTREGRESGSEICQLRYGLEDRIICEKITKNYEYDTCG